MVLYIYELLGQVHALNLGRTFAEVRSDCVDFYVRSYETDSGLFISIDATQPGA